MQKILVTGGGGLLAHHIKTIAPQDWEIILVGHGEFDLTNASQMEQQLAEIQPHAVVNTAAYNLVDRCEIERELSWAVNADGPEKLAKLCARKGIRLVHYGTDYVFDGAKKTPYVETDTPRPLNHYAAGKFAGEQAVLAAAPANLVLRTSWVFDWHPSQTKSFVHTVMKAAKEGRPLKATTDQESVPTCAGDLANWTLELLQRDGGGLFHAVNDEGVSRYEWTRLILEAALESQLVNSMPPVEPVLSSFFNSTMRRPDYTVMGNAKLALKLGRPMGSWRPGLRKMLAQLK